MTKTCNPGQRYTLQLRKRRLIRWSLDVWHDTDDDDSGDREYLALLYREKAKQVLLAAKVLEAR